MPNFQSFWMIEGDGGCPHSWMIEQIEEIEKNEIVELYVDYFFQNQGIGSALIEYAKDKYPVEYLWAIEKNVDAIRFYEKHGFRLTNTRKYEEGTTEFLVKMEKS